MVQNHTTEPGWEHFEAVLRVARGASIRQAAAGLGIAHTTLAKRVAAAERAFGAVLFVRSPQGYALTDAGRHVVASAERMEAEAGRALSAVGGRDRGLRGRVTVSVMAPVLTQVLAPALADFHGRYGEIELRFDTSYTLADLRRQRADLAIRFQDEPDEMLVGRRVVTQCDALYVARDFTAAEDDDPSVRSVVSWGAGRSFEARAAEHGVHGVRVVASAEDIGAQAALVRAGLGIGMLPCFLGDTDPGLRRWGTGSPLPINDAWVLTHPDLVASARVKAVADVLVAALKRARPLFAGDGASRP